MDRERHGTPLATDVRRAIAPRFRTAPGWRRIARRSAAVGAKTGAVLALSLIATTMAMNYGFEARSISLWLINAGCMVVGMTVMGAIIGGWKKKG